MSIHNEQVIAATIDYLVAHPEDAPDLPALAARAGYDATHFQKLFKDKVGVSPKQFQTFMKLNRARDFLLQGYPTLEAAYQAGLSGNGRLHDLFVTYEAATPGDVKAGGTGLTIHYGYHPTMLGEVLIGVTERGVCWLGFVVNEERDMPFIRLRGHWPDAVLIEDASKTQSAADQIMAIWQGKAGPNKLALYLHGTNFQIQVWQALMKIPCGGAVSYQQVANFMNCPKASRAVGSAVGKNPISLLIPCHRVIQKSGVVENYGWGTPRKKALLGLEAEHIAHGIEAGRLAV